jgi:CheY-like chemotaxis protein
MKRVLVIDDDEGVRLTLNHVLVADGYAVWTAADGIEGVKLAQSCRPDVVLTDLLMPKQDGLETIALLKREHPDLRIVAMSGGLRMGHGDILESASKSGADRVLAKPFDLTALLQLLPTLVEQG